MSNLLHIVHLRKFEVLVQHGHMSLDLEVSRSISSLAKTQHNTVTMKPDQGQKVSLTDPQLCRVRAESVFLLPSYKKKIQTQKIRGKKKNEDFGWNQTHRFLWNLVSDLVGLVEEAQSGDVAQRCKTPEEEAQRSTEVKRKKENWFEYEKASES